MKGEADKVLGIISSHIMNFSMFYKENVEQIYLLKQGNLYPQGTSDKDRSLNVSPVLSKLNEAVEKYNEQLFGEDVPALRSFIEKMKEEYGDNAPFAKDLDGCYESMLECNIPEIDVLSEGKFMQSSSDVFLGELKRVRKQNEKIIETLSEVPFTNGATDALYETMNSARVAVA